MSSSRARNCWGYQKELSRAELDYAVRKYKPPEGGPEGPGDFAGAEKHCFKCHVKANENTIPKSLYWVGETLRPSCSSLPSPIFPRPAARGQEGQPASAGMDGSRGTGRGGRGRRRQHSVSTLGGDGRIGRHDEAVIASAGKAGRREAAGPGGDGRVGRHGEAAIASAGKAGGREPEVSAAMDGSSGPGRP